MWITRPAVTALLVAMTGLPAMAQPIEIATLGHAPLLGQSTNAAEMKVNIQKNEALLRKAGMDLGLTPEQYQQFRLAMDVAQPNWVTVPRHLDAMTWSSGGQVHVLHDVIIPANQKGVEVDLRSGDRIISLFMPARCGNLSVIRRPVPHVAAAKTVPAPRVAAAAPPVEAPPAAVAAAPPEQEAPPPLVAAAVPPIPVAAAASHGFSLVPLLSLVPFVVHGGGGGGTNGPNTGTIIGPPPCP